MAEKIIKSGRKTHTAGLVWLLEVPAGLILRLGGARARRTRYVQLQESKHPSGKGLPGVEEKQSFSRYRGRRGSSPANSPYMI